MGNKRKFLPTILNIVNNIEKDLGRRLSIADGFSGTGIVSRLFKTKAHTLYVNDIAGYSETLNKCYLANLNDIDKKRINIIINQINVLINRDKSVDYKPWISKHWAPKDDENIKIDERVYFTEKNGASYASLAQVIRESHTRRSYAAAIHGLGYQWGMWCTGKSYAIVLHGGYTEKHI